MFISLVGAASRDLHLLGISYCRALCPKGLITLMIRHFLCDGAVAEIYISQTPMMQGMPCLPDNLSESYRQFIPPLIVYDSALLYPVTERRREPGKGVQP